MQPLSCGESMYPESGQTITFNPRKHEEIKVTGSRGGGGRSIGPPLYFQKCSTILTRNLVCAISVQYTSN